MDLSQISILDVFAAALVGIVLGAFWYSPIAFGKGWMNAIGKTPETLGSQTIPMLGSIVACLLTSIGVAIAQTVVIPTDIIESICLGLILGLLFIFPALLSDNLFCGWGTKLLFIQSGYRVLSVVLMSITAFLV